MIPRSSEHKIPERMFRTPLNLTVAFQTTTFIHSFTYFLHIHSVRANEARTEVRGRRHCPNLGPKFRLKRLSVPKKTRPKSF